MIWSLKITLHFLHSDIQIKPVSHCFLHLHLPAASKKQRVRFSNIMEVRQLPSTQALEAKLSRMSYPAAKDHEAMLRTVGKLTITDVAKISFFFCFVVSKSPQECQFLMLHCCRSSRGISIKLILFHNQLKTPLSMYCINKWTNCYLASQWRLIVDCGMGQKK